MSDEFREEERRRPAPAGRSTASTSAIARFLRRPSQSRPRGAQHGAPPIPFSVASSSTHNRQLSAPTSPLLAPVTTPATATLIQPSSRTTRSITQSIGTVLGFLRPPYHASISSDVLIDNARSLATLLRHPEARPPSFDNVFPSLQALCSARMAAGVRIAGFDLLSAIIDAWSDPDRPASSTTLLQGIDRFRLWNVIRPQWEPPPLPSHASKSNEDREPDGISGDEWDSRFAALSKLSSGGRHVEGLSDLLKTIIDWSRYFSFLYLETHPSSSHATDLNALEGVERRMSACFMFLMTVFKHNIQVLSDSQVDDLVGAFQSSLKESLIVPQKADESYGTRGSQASFPFNLPPVTPSRKSSSAAPNLTLRHRRHPSSQSASMSPLQLSQPPTPNASTSSSSPDLQNQSPASYISRPSYIVLAGLYLTFIETILKSSLFPSKHLAQTIQNLVLLLGTVAQSLLPVTDAKPKRRVTGVESKTEKLDSRTWASISTLIAGAYATSSARVIKSLLTPSPPFTPHSLDLAVRYSKGAARATRLALRSSAENRIAIARVSQLEDTASPSGMPVYTDEMADILTMAHSAYFGWDVSRVKDVLANGVKEWLSIKREGANTARWEAVEPLGRGGEDLVILEMLGIVQDIVDEIVEMERQMSDEEGAVVGEVLAEAVEFVALARTPDVQTYSLPSQTRLLDSHHPSAVVRLLASLISRIPLRSPLKPNLPTTLLSVSPSLPDGLAVSIIDYYFNEALPTPSSTEWLPILTRLFERMYLADRPVLRRTLSRGARKLYDQVRDLPAYRNSLLALCVGVWGPTAPDEADEKTLLDIWAVLGDGIVAGAAEKTLSSTAEGQGLSFSMEESKGLEEQVLSVIVNVANCCDCGLSASASTSSSTIADEATFGSPSFPNTPQAESPVSRSPSHYYERGRDPRDRGGANMMSLFSNVLNRDASPPSVPPTPSAAMDPHQHRHDSSPSPPAHHEANCKSLSAVLTLIHAFGRLAFSPPHSLDSDSPFKTARAPASAQCILVFQNLLSLLGPTVSCGPLPEGEVRLEGHLQARCPRARLAILQWVVRLRADRDHRLYVLRDVDAAVEPFAALLKRTKSTSDGNESTPSTNPLQGMDSERDSRQRLRSYTRGRGDIDPMTGSRGRSQSRSRSRFPVAFTEPPNPPPIWGIPETLPFDVPIGSNPSEGMTTYSADHLEHDGITKSLWLPVSTYVCTLVDIINDDSDWEVFSYVLCHLPLQLSNKHFFCGPRTRSAMRNLLSVLCDALRSKRLGPKITQAGLKATDVQGLAYHTLTVLIGYRDAFETQDRVLSEGLVQAFYQGLHGYPTAKPCIQALSICAFELPSSTTKFIPGILEKLTQIMSNPAIAAHILEFLSVIATIPNLYANLREHDFKLIFGLAAQYIQHHNRPTQVSMSTSGGARVTGYSFALSQHVLTLAYYVIYVWFLAIRLPDRPRYIPSIVRALLIATEAKGVVDEPTEVCFDWLMRYTYSNAAPRPTQSTFEGDLVGHSPPKQKAWLLGHAIIAIESLVRPGWIRMTSYRPSGTTRITCRVDNMARDRLEDIGEEIISALGPSGYSPSVQSMLSLGSDVPPDPESTVQAANEDTGNTLTINESLSGVSSPARGASRSTTNLNLVSQSPAVKLEDVQIDPSFVALQMAPYADPRSSSSRLLPKDQKLDRLIRNLNQLPVVDLHKVGVLYVGPGQTDEHEILRNRHGSPAYTRFLSGLGRLVKLQGQKEVYTAGLDTSEDRDGKYAYAWWDDIAQIIYHTATLMPNQPNDPDCNSKKMHIGNDWVRIIWNDGGNPYRFDTLHTDFQLVNVVIEPHSAGTIAAYSSSQHENEFFKVTLQRAPGVPEFTPIGDFKLLSAQNMPLYVRHVSLLADLFAEVYSKTQQDTPPKEFVTYWRARLQAIKQYKSQLPTPELIDGLLSDEAIRDFTRSY